MVEPLTTTFTYKMLSNISNFVTEVEKYGVEVINFSPEELVKEENVTQLVSVLRELAMLAEVKGFKPSMAKLDEAMVEGMLEPTRNRPFSASFSSALKLQPVSEKIPSMPKFDFFRSTSKSKGIEIYWLL